MTKAGQYAVKGRTDAVLDVIEDMMPEADNTSFLGVSSTDRWLLLLWECLRGELVAEPEPAYKGVQRAELPCYVCSCFHYMSDEEGSAK